ncbi:unnamed protein product [Closterium sp. NIES-53]
MTLSVLGFAPSTSDPSLFLRTDTTLPPFYVLVYIDDLVFATADTEALAHVKSELQKRHTCTDLGEPTSYLGLRITRDRAQRTITLTQSHMVHQVLQRFSFTYSSPLSTPLPTGHSLSAPPSDESIESSGPYPELVGCLMYLVTCTRPDLVYPLSLLTRYVALGRHRKVHWDAAKRVLRYLCSTSGMGLVLGGRARVVLTGHADASWVDDLATLRSSQGYTFSLGSGFVSWRSTRSSSVLSSSCEAEIYAEAMAAQELHWLTYLLTDLGEAPRSPPVLMKHIALRYFLARELQQRGQLRLAYVASQANTAVVFTKALQPCGHQPYFAFLDWSCDLLFSPTLPMGYSHSFAHILTPTAIGPASTEALHTFMLDSGVSRCFFRDCTTVTPVAAPVLVSLADRTGGPIVARASTVLPCPAVPSGSLSGLHLSAFSTNLLSNAVLQDEWVDTFIPGGQRVAIYKCSRTGHHLATFTRQPGSGLYTLTTVSTQMAESGQVAVSSRVSASGQLAVSCSCLLLSHQTLLSHHRLGHPSLPRLRSMHSRLLVSGLPRSLPSLPHSPAPPCLPRVEGWQQFILAGTSCDIGSYGWHPRLVKVRRRQEVTPPKSTQQRRPRTAVAIPLPITFRDALLWLPFVQDPPLRGLPK